MIEVWKDIDVYEGLYQVSTLGRVKSLNYNHTRKEKILKPGKVDGYFKIILCKDNVTKSFRIHRLVAKAFIPNPQNLPFVNHKDENKENNCVENLEWCDVKYNNNYGTAIKRSVEKRSKKILCIETNIIYPSVNDVERKTEIIHSNIVACLKERRKTAGGFHWKYID